MTGTSINSILAFALLVGVASQANADIWGHIDRQSADIKYAAKQLRTEVDHYRHTRHYGQLIGATARLKGQAISVHNIAIHSHSVHALKHAVKELDRAFHDAERLFDLIEHSAANGDGYVRGNTAHVKEQLNCISDCIAYLREDLRKLARIETSRHRKAYHPPVSRQPAYDINRYQRGSRYGSGYGRPAYNSGYRNVDQGYRQSRSGFGFSIGGGSSRITFNF